MLKSTCINPKIMETLAFCGHGDKIVLVDSNYPLAMRSGDAAKVYLGVSPGLPTVPQVFEALLGAVSIEKIEAMVPADGETPEVLKEVMAMAGDTELVRTGRFEFYDAACQPDVCLAISTGESRTYGCLLLTVGVVT